MAKGKKITEHLRTSITGGILPIRQYFLIFFDGIWCPCPEAGGVGDLVAYIKTIEIIPYKSTQ